MVLAAGNPHRGLRNRLGKLSESMLNLLTSDSKSRHVHSALNVLISRVVVGLFSASLLLFFLSGLRTGYAPSSHRHAPVTRGDADSAIAQQLKSDLSAEDYPIHLVSESQPFKMSGSAANAGDSQSSLVEARSDREITVAPNIDSDEEPVARMIVITMDRDESLVRLLDSLAKANYGEDHVDLDIWIDRANDKPIHEGVLHACQKVIWKQGTKTVHKRAANAGLYEQWIYTWNITAETTEFAVILEDDLEVSPAFYQWLRVARAAYAQDSDVGAFTLQRSTLRPRGASRPLDIPAEHPVFKYRLLGTWGFAPQRDAWVEFRKWFEEKRGRGEKPYVDGLITTQWYKSQEKDGFAPNMWSQWWIKFADEKGYFTVTGHLPDGTSLASNWRESGLHYSKNKPSADFPVFRGGDDEFVMPDNPILVDWDGQIISAKDSGSS